MYENGIDVVYELREPQHGSATRTWSEHRKVTLPGWCAGDPQMGVALYLFGYRQAAEDVRVTDWQPRDDDADDEPFPSDRILASREGGVIVFEPGTVTLDPETGEFERIDGGVR